MATPIAANYSHKGTHRNKKIAHETHEKHEKKTKKGPQITLINTDYKKIKKNLCNLCNLWTFSFFIRIYFAMVLAILGLSGFISGTRFLGKMTWSNSR